MQMKNENLKFLGQQALALRLAMQNKTAPSGAGSVYKDLMHGIDNEIAVLKHQYPKQVWDETSPEYRALVKHWAAARREREALVKAESERQALEILEASYEQAQNQK